MERRETNNGFTLFQINKLSYTLTAYNKYFRIGRKISVVKSVVKPEFIFKLHKNSMK